MINDSHLMANDGFKFINKYNNNRRFYFRIKQLNSENSSGSTRFQFNYKNKIKLFKITKWPR